MSCKLFDVPTSLELAIGNFASQTLQSAAQTFWQSLGYDSDRKLEIATDPAAFAREFGIALPDDLMKNAREIAFLFQLSSDSIQKLRGQNALFGGEFDQGDEKSYIFLALSLDPKQSYSRTALSNFARALNKPFGAPVLLLIHHGDLLSLAVVDRRPSKLDASRDVLEKVTLLKDIRLDNPHGGQLKILRDLQFADLRASNWDELHREWKRVLDLQTLNAQFYRDYKIVFDIAEKSAVLPPELEPKRRDWTQRLFNRLLFLRFLEKKGWLEFGGSPDYLRALWNAPRAKNQTFLGDRLYWAFFHGLNTLREDSELHTLPQLVERRGQVPFLNGGLFDLDKDFDAKDAVRFANENEVFSAILGLFERYYFTVDETTPLEQEVGIDPEMLGKVFEELTNERTQSGSYYTPRVVVSFMAREALKGYLGKCDTSAAIENFVENGDAHGLKRPREILRALEEVRICDPACGSGAYLLGTMQELLRLRDALFAAHNIDDLEIYDRKLEIIERNLYGADLTDFAVNIAMLRLWLSLVVDYNGELKNLPALPNLQYKIGRGDSLTAPDPTDKGKIYHSSYLPLAGELSLLHREWFEESYRRSKGEITRSKPEIKADIDAKMDEISRKIGKAPDDSHDWRLKFAEVFAHGGFDIVLANPPYGASVADATRNLFFAGGQGQSKDTYGLFMARGLQLLKPGGWFTFIVSDTWRTIKSHRPLRKRLLENASVAHVLDLPSWIFGATVNTGILTFQKGAPGENHRMLAADLRALPNGDWNGLSHQLREVARGGEDVQTFQIARYTFPQKIIGTYDNASFFVAAPKLYELMSDRERFRPLGEVAEVKVGLQTGDNEYYLRKRVGARGSYAILDESKLLHEAEIAALSSDEKLNGVDPKKYAGRCFVPYDKGGASDAEGGWMPNYHVPTEYFIDWSKIAVNRLKTATVADIKRKKGESKIRQKDELTLAAVIRNSSFYFDSGITFSRIGIYAPTFRISADSVFDMNSSCIFPQRDNVLSTIGLISSLLQRYL